MQATRAFFDPFVLVVPSFLDTSAIATWRARVEALAYEADAPIRTAHGFARRPSRRNNDRAVVDRHDWAEAMWPATRAVLPPVDGYEAVGLNERFRVYRYGPGQRFAPHLDGSFVRPGGEARSLLTWLLYLEGDCVGGATHLPHHDLEVAPVPGTLLVFEHRQLHAGLAVREGRKTVLRSDVMYRAVAPR
jgi:hypothetical protein